jgi:subtilisin
MAGASVATAAGSGLAAASSGDSVRVSIGFSAESGRAAALDAADEVIHDFNSIDAVTVRGQKAPITALEQRSDVTYVEEDGTVQALSETLPWGQDRIDSDVLHSNGELGSGADVAIIDTGIDDDHPDLTDHLGKGKAFVTCDTKGGCRYGRKPAENTCNYPWTDDNNHGTHCAGIAAGDDNTEGVVGVAPDATLHAVKVLDKCGSGYLSDVAAGIEYVADQGWDVGSLSLGADSGDSTLKSAVQYAYDNGVLLVGAAGNDGPCSDCVGYPAAYQEVVAVSATTPTDSLSGYSSTGPEVELAAPGGASDDNDSTSVYSSIASNASYDYYNGTSMACPHVSGVGGQLMTNGYTNTDARSQLQDTAKDIGLASNEQGHGLVDAAAALGYDSSDN